MTVKPFCFNAVKAVFACSLLCCFDFWRRNAERFIPPLSSACRVKINSIQLQSMLHIFTLLGLDFVTSTCAAGGSLLNCGLKCGSTPGGVIIV